MSDERCLNCGHDDPHKGNSDGGKYCLTCANEIDYRRPLKDQAICTADQRTIAALRAEVERLTKAFDLLGLDAEGWAETERDAALGANLRKLVSECDDGVEIYAFRWAYAPPNSPLLYAVRFLDTDDGPEADTLDAALAAAVVDLRGEVDA